MASKIEHASEVALQQSVGFGAHLTLKISLLTSLPRDILFSNKGARFHFGEETFNKLTTFSTPGSELFDFDEADILVPSMTIDH